jgi:hypothetical protein
MLMETDETVKMPHGKLNTLKASIYQQAVAVV